jgi:hypothetical protein
MLKQGVENVQMHGDFYGTQCDANRVGIPIKRGQSLRVVLCDS